MKLGSDFSKWQVSLNPSRAISAGISWIIFRASLGYTYKDEKYDQFVTQARAANLLTGAYHYYKPSYDPIQQANWFYACVGQRWVHEIEPVVDVEEYTSLSDRTQRLGRFLARVEELTGRRPIIYSSKSVWDACYPGVWLRFWKFWVANYRSDAGPLMPAVLSPTDWYMWQWTSAASGPDHGAGSNYVDLDTVNGDFTAPWHGPIADTDRIVTAEQSAPVVSAAWCAMMNRLHQSERGRV